MKTLVLFLTSVTIFGADRLKIDTSKLTYPPEARVMELEDKVVLRVCVAQHKAIHLNNSEFEKSEKGSMHEKFIAHAIASLAGFTYTGRDERWYTVEFTFKIGNKKDRAQGQPHIGPVLLQLFDGPPLEQDKPCPTRIKEMRIVARSKDRKQIFITLITEPLCYEW